VRPLRIQRADATLELEVLSARVVRARLIVPGQGPPGQAVALPRTDPNVQVDARAGDPYVIRTANLVIHVEVNSLRLRVEDASGELFLQVWVLRCTPEVG
jgi:hypothetical protein